MNTAIVRSRSRYSSMSRLMKVRLLFALDDDQGSCAAVRYSGSSRSATCSTTSSKAHIEMRLATAETFTET